MPLQEDWNELKKTWSKLSHLGKIISVVSFVITCTSVASLADSIFEFRGFILTGIEFYRSILDYLQVIGLVISGPKRDVFVAMLLIITGVMKHHDSNTPLFLFPYSVYIMVVPVVPIGLIFDEPDRALVQAVWMGSIALFQFLVILSYAIIPFVTKRELPYTLSARFILRYILTICFLIAVIAAISEGLTRPV